jgi:hypothetical protein
MLQQQLGNSIVLVLSSLIGVEEAALVAGRCRTQEMLQCILDLALGSDCVGDSISAVIVYK